MALPINIDDLINGRTVEWERIEFKEGWNPEPTLKTICAFANDFNNWGGGYIVIGIQQLNGRPVLPPIGLDINSIDRIQQELNNLCRKIIQNYFPVVEPVDFQDKKILILWCPGGGVRPYKAPDSLGQNPQYFHFIRKNSLTVRPTVEDERELFSMANRIPFDDQINHHAQLSDLDLSLIKTFLTDVKSDLVSQIPDLSISQIARQMNIAEGADENLLPKNVGLLFFAQEPQRFFPNAKIEIVTFENETGDTFTEKIFTGNLHTQLRSALQYLKDNFIIEKVSKVEGHAEANRFFNYPYEAIEEALCNAVYHRGYDDDSTIEVRIYPAYINIISYPGPLLPLDKQKLIDQQFDVRKYRNRRIGEFLKELRLTEGRATGIPTIKNALEKNGSPAAVFETDDDRTYFKTTLKIHSGFISTVVKVGFDPHIGNTTESTTELQRSSNGVGTELNRNQPQSEFQKYIEKSLGLTLGQFESIVSSLSQVCPKSVPSDLAALVLLSSTVPTDLKKLMKIVQQTNRSRFRNNIINPLISTSLLEYTIPDRPSSSKQKYITTDKGKSLLSVKK